MTDIELSRRERKKDETRRRIFDAAIALFREKGFESTTVDEITAHADVARGTFFNYFPKKENVLGYLSEQQAMIAEEQTSALLQDPRPVREKLLHFYALAAAAYEENKELSRWVFGEWLQRAFQPTEDASRRWESVLHAVIEQGKTGGQLRSDVETPRAEAVLSSVYIATLYSWLYCPPDCVAGAYALQPELRARLDVVLDGLVAKGGRA